MSAISAIDRLSLVKYVFPSERLPEWVRIALQNDRDCRVLADLCPLFKGRLTGDFIKGGSFQVQLNVFEYYLFWFAYYPVCKGNSENFDAVRVRRSKRFRLENWACSIPGFSTSNTKRGREQKNEYSLYIRLLYAYLRAFVPLSGLDLSSQSPYRSSLLHYSSGYDALVVDHAEFLVHTLIHFWLVDNDFSPLSVSVCKSFGVTLPLRSVLSEMPPTAGLGEVVNVFVKYLDLSLIGGNGRCDQVVSVSGSPVWRGSVSVGAKSKDMISGVRPVSTWNSWIQRPLYRYVLRTFIFCPVETSIKNVSQVFSIWVNYIDPWMISLDDFAELDADVGVLEKNSVKEVNQLQPREYSSCWQGFVLANYLFYSSLVMHFIGFAHKFLHTDPEVILQMVSKVVNILASSDELVELIKSVDTVFHSVPVGSSKSMLNTLYRFVPSIREQLQDWEDGLSESGADGSFLHENWNKDLQLFGTGEDGGRQLLQLFVLRAEAELQAIGGDNVVNNLQLLDSLKAKVGSLFGGYVLKSTSGTAEPRQCEKSRNEVFSPRVAGNFQVAGIKNKGDRMMRPISGDEVAFLARLLVTLSLWLNERLGLNQRESSMISPGWSYLEVSSNSSNVYGLAETMKLVLRSVFLWLIVVGREALKFMREHGLRVNLRMLASKKIVSVLLIIVGFSAVKRVFPDSM